MNFRKHWSEMLTIQKENDFELKISYSVKVAFNFKGL